MSRDISPFGLRMPSELKKAIEDSASHNRRSLNAEIVDRLESSFKASGEVQSNDSKAMKYAVTAPNFMQFAVEHFVPVRAALAINQNYSEDIADAFNQLAAMIESGQTNPDQLDFLKVLVEKKVMAIKENTGGVNYSPLPDGIKGLLDD